VVGRALVRLAVLVVDGVGGVDFIASLDAAWRRISAHGPVGRSEVDAPVRTVLEEQARAQDVALVDVESLAVVAGRCQYGAASTVLLGARGGVDLRGVVAVEMLNAGLDDGRACRETGED
jgi:hypothetical protein